MAKIYSIRIIRKENQATEGEYVKQFLMFCGVYIREAILEYENENKTFNCQEVDCNIFLTELDRKPRLQHGKTTGGLSDVNALGTTVPADRFRAKKNIKINARYNDCAGSGSIKRKNFGKQIKQQLLSAFTEDKSDITKIYDAFINNDIAYLNYFCHLYLYQFDKKTKEHIIEKYTKCLKGIYKPKEKFNGSVYKKFAYLNCGRKINKICQANRQLPYANVETIMKEAKSLSEKDAKFSIGNVLAGLSGIADYNQEREAERCLYQVLKQENGQKHSTFVLYMVGQHYEKNKHDWPMAWELYKKMGNISLNDYRYMYKCGCKAIREENYAEAQNIFTKIYSEMKKRSQNGWISLLEMEYYYKCAKILTEMKKKQFIYISIDSPEFILYKLTDNHFLNAFLSNEEKERTKNYFQLKMDGFQN